MKDHLVKGAPVEVVGFGLTTKSGMGMNTRLNEATMAVTDPTCTSDPYCNASIAPGGEFVAGGMGTDSCFGDSGGPLFVPTQHGPALIGVVSRGVGASGSPCGGGGIYVRADKVVPWIEKLTGRKLDRAPCDGKADGEGDGDESSGGCSIGGGSLAGGALVLAIIGWVLTIPRRRKR